MPFDKNKTKSTAAVEESFNSAIVEQLQDKKQLLDRTKQSEQKLQPPADVSQVIGFNPVLIFDEPEIEVQ